MGYWNLSCFRGTGYPSQQLLPATHNTGYRGFAGLGGGAMIPGLLCEWQSYVLSPSSGVPAESVTGMGLGGFLL